MKKITYELELLSKQYSLCFLKLTIKRSYDWINEFNYEDSSIAEELLEHHHEFNRGEDHGVGPDMDFHVSVVNLAAGKSKENRIEFEFESVLVIRRPLGKLLEMKLPDAPLEDDGQFEDYNIGTYHEIEGGLKHEGYWEELSEEGFVNWLYGIKGNIMVDTRDRGVVYVLLKRYAVSALNHIVGLNKSVWWYHPKIGNYYCNEREWNEYVVISIWRYYIGLKVYGSRQVKKKEEWSYLWENYREIIEFLENKYYLFRNNGKVYELTSEYVEKAKELVMEYPYLLE